MFVSHPGFQVNLRDAHRPHGEGVGRVELLGRDEVREVLLDHVIVPEDDGLDHVAQDETVEVDHVRQQNVVIFGHPEGVEGHVVGFLAVFHEDLDPARVAHRHHVAVIVPDADGAGQSPVGHGHDDGQAQRRRDIEDLLHEDETLGRCRRVGPGTGGRGAAAAAHGRVLGFHGHELRIQRAVRHQFREVFHDVRLGRDGVGRHHVHIRLAGRLGHGNGNLDSLSQFVRGCAAH